MPLTRKEALSARARLEVYTIEEELQAGSPVDAYVNDLEVLSMEADRRRDKSMVFYTIFAHPELQRTDTVGRISNVGNA